MKAFWALRLENSLFVRACFQATFPGDYWNEFGRLGLLKPGLRLEGIATNNLHRNRFYGFWGRFVLGDAFGTAFLIFAALETDLKIDGFSMV